MSIAQAKNSINDARWNRR